MKEEREKKSQNAPTDSSKSNNSPDNTINIRAAEHEHLSGELNKPGIDSGTKESSEPGERGGGGAVKDDTLSMISSMSDTDGPGRSGGELFEESGDGENVPTNRANKSSYDWRIGLDQANRYNLAWHVDYPNNKIIFALSINTRLANFKPNLDIFALGFSETGQVGNSDICLIWHDLDHQLHLQDAHIDKNNRLQMIPSRVSHCILQRTRAGNSNLAYQTESSGADESHSGAGMLEVEFRRPLDICDDGQQHRYRIDNGTTNLIWFTIEGPLASIDGLNLTSLTSSPQRGASKGLALELDGSSWPPKGRAFEFGLKRVQLVASKINGQTGTANRGPSLELRMDRFKIPAQETTYWCRLLKLPHKFESRRYHITSYEAAIEPGNEPVVHHMELFNCANLDQGQAEELEELHQLGGWSGNCNGPHRPKATAPCKRVVLAWAMGAHKLVYPVQVGQPIGGRDYSPFMVLEVHYNNIGSRPNLIDSSGLRFRYTSKLRAYDAGVLEVGLEYTDKNSIPPRMVTPLAGHCASECTRVAMGPAGVHVFAAQMHTHLTGVASWTEIVRGGKLIGELQRDDHYSPHFQEIRILPEPVHLAPGDALVHYCLYDTLQRDNITLGGFATSDEMCVTYLHYYPKIELEVCKSSVDTRTLEAYFSYLASEELQPTSHQLADHEATRARAPEDQRYSVAQNYRSIRWSARRAKELMQLYASSPLSVQCIRSNGTAFAGGWDGITPTRLWHNPERGKPTGWRLEEPEQLVAYRGQGFRARHAQCAAITQTPERPDTVASWPAPSDR